MQLGLNTNEIRLSTYTPEWNEEFTRVKNKILKYTAIQVKQIEHIGSTAIKGMMAKPIIDIIIGVDDLNDLDDSIISGLKKVGFLRLRVERPGEVVFAKFTDDTYKVKTHFIHLVEFQKELWSNLIFFRDYLNSNEEERENYLAIKLDYVRKFSSGINEYTDHKEDFVKGILKKRKN